MSVPFLQNDKIILRAPEEEDAVVFAAAANHPLIRNTLYIALPTSVEENKDLIRAERSAHDTVTFTVCRADNRKAIGVTKFVRIDWPGRMATFYIALANGEDKGKGFGTAVTSLMTAYAFDTLNLNRIQLHVSVRNTAAIHVYKKCGFKTEGTLRQAMYFDGGYIDFYLMALLREEWKNRSTE